MTLLLKLGAVLLFLLGCICYVVSIVTLRRIKQAEQGGNVLHGIGLRGRRDHETTGVLRSGEYPHASPSILQFPSPVPEAETSPEDEGLAIAALSGKLGIKQARRDVETRSYIHELRAAMPERAEEPAD